MKLSNSTPLRRASSEQPESPTQPASNSSSQADKSGTGLNLLTRANGRAMDAKLRQQLKEMDRFSSGAKLSKEERAAADKAKAFAGAGNMLISTGQQGIAPLADRQNLDHLMQSFKNNDTAALKAAATGNNQLRKLMTGLQALGPSLAGVAKMAGEITPHQQAISADASALLKTVIAEAGGKQYTLSQFGTPDTYDKIQLTPAQQRTLRRTLAQVADLLQNTGDPEYRGKPAAASQQTAPAPAGTASMAGANLKRRNAVATRRQQGPGQSVDQMKAKFNDLQASASNAFKPMEKNPVESMQAKLTDLQKAADDAFKLVKKQP